MKTCPFCFKDHDDPTAGYYHYHDCWTKNVLRKIVELKKDPNYDKQALIKLEAELQMARYVGD